MNTSCRLLYKRQTGSDRERWETTTANEFRSGGRFASMVPLSRNRPVFRIGLCRSKKREEIWAMITGMARTTRLQAGPAGRWPVSTDSGIFKLPWALAAVVLRSMYRARMGPLPRAELGLARSPEGQGAWSGPRSSCLARLVFVSDGPTCVARVTAQLMKMSAA